VASASPSVPYAIGILPVASAPVRAQDCDTTAEANNRFGYRHLPVIRRSSAELSLNVTARLKTIEVVQPDRLFLAKARTVAGDTRPWRHFRTVEHRLGHQSQVLFDALADPVDKFLEDANIEC
jgi:hypothetical protein